MPYITSDGSIQKQEPWSIRKVLYIPVDIFWGILHYIYVFFASICGYKPPKTVQGGSIIRSSPNPNRLGNTLGGNNPGDGAKLRSTTNVRGMNSLRPDPCAKGG